MDARMKMLTLMEMASRIISTSVLIEQAQLYTLVVQIQMEMVLV